MKFPYFLKPLAAFGLLSLLVACDSVGEKSEKGNGSAEVTEETMRERLFSRWLSKAELQFRMEKLSPGEYFSVVEGRHYLGNNQYRAIAEIFDGTRYREWAVFWGLTEKELFDYEITLLRLGFERHHSQVFTDSSGQALHQLVMLCPIGAEPFDDRPLTSAQETLDAITRVLEPEKVDEPALDSPADPQEAKIEVPDPSGPEFGNEVAEVVENSPGNPPELVIEEEVAVVVGELDLPQEPVTPPVAEVVKPTEVPVKVDPPKAKIEPKEQMRNHIVVKGDTLSSISRRHRVSVGAIKKANGMSSDMIRIGQLLKIPTK